MTISWLSDFI